MRVTTNRTVQAMLLGLLLLLPTSHAQEPLNVTEVQPAAEQGHARSQVALGIMYYLGQGGAQYYKQAAAWYGKAAGQGDTDAQRFLGDLYYLGKGVPQDYKQAAAWFRKAAEQGHATAQFLLGGVHYTGQGVPQDYLQAYTWFSVAAANGEPDSPIGRDAVAALLSPQQLESAQKTAAEYFEKHQPKTSKSR